MNLVRGIALKLISTLLFAVMGALVRAVGREVPLGEVVFFRSAWAILPLVVIYAWRGELVSAVLTRRPLGHLGRGTLSVGGMFCNFGSLARLPLVEASALTFLSPLVTVALAAIVLKERVRIYRWSAVILGFLGVLVMLVPHMRITTTGLMAGATVGAILGVIAACFNAAVVIQTRRLTQSENTSTIVFYFSLTCALAGLATLPLGWIMPTPLQLTQLISLGVIGGLSHILLTESYRFAPASVVAPFDYTAMVWAFVLGYLAFGELPDVYVYVGSAIVAAAGLFVIFRERRLGLRRRKDQEGLPT